MRAATLKSFCHVGQPLLGLSDSQPTQAFCLLQMNHLGKCSRMVVFLSVFEIGVEVLRPFEFAIAARNRYRPWRHAIAG